MNLDDEIAELEKLSFREVKAQVEQAEKDLAEINERWDRGLQKAEKRAAHILRSYVPEASEEDRTEAAVRAARGLSAPLFDEAMYRLREEEASADGRQAALHRLRRRPFEALRKGLIDKSNQRAGLRLRIDAGKRVMMDFLSTPLAPSNRDAPPQGWSEDTPPSGRDFVLQKAKQVFNGKQRAEGSKTRVHSDVIDWTKTAYKHFYKNEGMEAEAVKSRIQNIAAKHGYHFSRRSLERWVGPSTFF